MKMFKLRIEAQKGSENYNKGIKGSIVSRGTKKEMVRLANLTSLKAEVIREKDNAIVYTNNQ